MAIPDNRFVARIVEMRGARGIFLTDTAYPYGNNQIIPMREEYRERVVKQLRSNLRYPVQVKGRRDFIAVNMGNSVDIEIPEEGYYPNAVADAIQQSARDAAAWWMEHYPEPVDYDNIDLPVIGEEKFKRHPTFNGQEPVPVPEGLLEKWTRKYQDYIIAMENFKKAREADDSGE